MPAAVKPKNRATSRPAPAAQEPWFRIVNEANQTPEIRFVGIIGQPTEFYDYWEGRMVKNANAAGSFEEFLNEIDAIGDVPELIINICSPGGDYGAGIAIHDRLARHPANKVCIIDGDCSSAATYIALACQTIKMPANARMMIHRAEGGCWGNVDDLQEYMDMLAWIDGNIADLYAQRCGSSAEEMLAMMSNETQFNGQQAVEIGLADEVLPGVAKAAANVANFRAMNFAMPAAARALFDKSRNPSPANSAPPIMSTPATPPPAAPAAPAPAPAPITNVVQTPEPAPAPQSSASSFSLADITAAITNAVAPLNDRLATLESQQRAGITPGNLAGAQPATNVAPTEAPAPVVNYATMSAAQIINLGRQQVAKAGKLVPASAE